MERNGVIRGAYGQFGQNLVVGGWWQERDTPLNTPFNIIYIMRSIVWSRGPGCPPESKPRHSHFPRYRPNASPTAFTNTACSS